MILTKIAVFVGRGLLGTGESISDECGVIGSAEHLRSTIEGYQFNVLRLLCVYVYFKILSKIAVFVGRGLLGTGEPISDECGALEAQNIIEVPFKGLSSMCCVYFV